MTYFTAIKAVVQLEEAVYPELAVSGKIARYAVINVMALGAIHALFSLYFSDMLLSPGVSFAGKVFFVAAGIGVAFLVHAGAALFLWVFTRGAGGRVEFLPMYMNIGVALVALWPLAPFLSAVQSGMGGVGLYILLGAASLFGFVVLFTAAKNASQLSAIRMAAAMVVCLVVIASMLYIWL